MGIVLPGGVLNNSNMQKVKEFVESRAKILLIVSIPQDVFMASGATVKPSLLFFKKFTEKEKAMYSSIEKETNDTVKMKYNSELFEIDRLLSLRGKEAPTKEEKKELKAKKKKLEEQIAIEVRQIIKKNLTMKYQ